MNLSMTVYANVVVYKWEQCHNRLLLVKRVPDITCGPELLKEAAYFMHSIVVA
jgi:hypothetical protein